MKKYLIFICLFLCAYTHKAFGCGGYNTFQYLIGSPTGTITCGGNCYQPGYTGIWAINTGIEGPVQLTLSIDTKPNYDLLAIFNSDSTFSNLGNIGNPYGSDVVYAHWGGFTQTTITTTLPTGCCIVHFIPTGGNGNVYPGITINYEGMPAENSDPFGSKMDSIFQYVNRSKVTTGLLSDYGLQLIEPEDFNGIPADSNYVDMDTWKMLYAGMFTSQFNSNITMDIIDTVFTQIDSAKHATAVPLAMMHYEYNCLNEEAVTLGLLQVVNEQIIEVPGAASPYLTRQLFAVAPQELYFKPITSFVFKQDLWYSNVTKTIQKREVNFNNESGYITAAWDTPVSYNFNSTGIKTIYFRLTYTDGSSYTSQTNIMVEPFIVQFKSTSPLDTEIPKSSLHSGGEIQVRLSSYNTSGEIKKPLIVAEGFDPSWLKKDKEEREKANVDVGDFLSLVSTEDTTTIGSIRVPYFGGNLYDNINMSKYDIVYLDYNNGVDDIKRNAQLFREVIQWVNANKVGNEPNVVMGISMGGLVARYALRKMEVDGINHQTSLYISVDAPHKGANVPVGAQAMVRHVENFKLEVFFVPVFKPTYIGSFREVIDLFDSPAAKQMLIYYMKDDYSFDNSVHNAFQSEYDQLGFPQQCLNIAIANGSSNGTKIFNPGVPLIDVQFEYTYKWWLNLINAVLGGNWGIFAVTNFKHFMLNMIPGKSSIKANISVKALKDKSVSQIYNGHVYYRKKMFGIINNDQNIAKKSVNSLGSMLPVDGAPGGLYSMERMGASLPFDTANIKQKQFCFVPTVSALALSNWEEKLNQDLLLSATNYFLTGKTGFEQIDAYPYNERHTRFNNSALFLYNRLNEPYLHIPAISPITGTYSVPNNTTLYIQRGQLLEVNGGTVTNANIVAYPGSKIVLKGGGIIQLRNNGTLDMWRGAILDMQNGDIKITP